jgi:protein-disulfide isomerase
LARLGLCWLVASSLAAQEKADRAQPVAVVSGETLTVQDLEQKEGGQLLQAQYQYYMTQRKAVDRLIDDELLRLAAQGKGLTVGQLLEREVYKEVKDPTEDQLEVYYEGLDTEESYAAVHDRVLEHIRELRRNKARAAYVSQLRSAAQVRVLLSPPWAKVNIEDAYVRGSKGAPVVLVEFADYECPYCEKVNPLLQKLKAQYGDKLAITYKDFPLPMHHRAEKAAEAARCAGEQGKFWEYHDVLFHSRLLDINDLKQHARVLGLDGDRFDHCLDTGKEAAAVKKDAQEGQSLGLTGTPSFFVNGHFFSGAVEYATLQEMVEQQLISTSTPATQLSKK